MKILIQNSVVVLLLFILMILSQCTLYKKEEALDSELKGMTQEVLKEKKGIEIQILPVPEAKNVLR